MINSETEVYVDCNRAWYMYVWFGSGYSKTSRQAELKGSVEEQY